MRAVQNSVVALRVADPHVGVDACEASQAIRVRVFGVRASACADRAGSDWTGGESGGLGHWSLILRHFKAPSRREGSILAFAPSRSSSSLRRSAAYSVVR
jgi:hypothetical protein